MDILQTANTSWKIYKTLAKGHKLYRDYKVKILLETISFELAKNDNLSADSIKNLIQLSHTKHFQESIDLAVTRTILSNSTLAIRMMAIKVAQTLDKPLSFEDILSLLPTSVGRDESFCRGPVVLGLTSHSNKSWNTI